MATSDVNKPPNIPLPSLPPAQNPPQNPSPSAGYGAGNPSPNLLDRYSEVYNRDGINGDANKAALLWDSKGQSSDWAGQEAYGNFMQTFGRAPTLDELNQFIPTYQGGYAQGNAALAAYHQLDQQKPQNQQANAGKYADQINQVFQSQLGRSATQDEVTHFGGMLSSGNLDSYGLQQFLTGTPEYQNQQDTQFRSGLDQQLQSSDLNFFNRASQGVNAQFMQNGTGQSSALSSALTDLMGQISNNRSQYLAQLSASQYGGNKNLALSNYGNTQNQYLQNQGQQRQMSLNSLYGAQNQAQSQSNYDQQMRDYMQGQQGRNTLHSGDWLNIGLAGIDTGVKAYSAANGMGGGGGGGGYNAWGG